MVRAGLPAGETARAGEKQPFASPVPTLLTGSQASDNWRLRTLARILSISTFPSFRSQADGLEGKEEQRPPRETTGKAGSPGAPELLRQRWVRAARKKRGSRPVDTGKTMCVAQTNVRSQVWLTAAGWGGLR